jgi:hypothetical protein
MKRLRFMVVAVAASLIVLAGVVPALAGSSGNPQWSVEGAQLKLGETKSVTGEASGIQKLKSGETTIACTGLSLGAGSTISGGAGAAAGTGSEQLVYSGCIVENTTTETPYTGCKVNSVGETAGTLKTEKLTAKLAYATLGAAEREEPSTVTALKPESGTIFLTIEYSGEGCPAPGNGKYKGEGELVLKNPEGSVEKAKHTAEAPLSSVKKYFTNVGGVPQETKVEGLKVQSMVNAVYVGNSIMSKSPEGSWSAIK